MVLASLSIIPAVPSGPGWRDRELFHGLTDVDFECVRRCLGAAFVEFERGRRVLSAAESAGRIGVVLSGVVLDVSEHEDGVSAVADVIEPGGLFGDGWNAGTEASRVIVAATEGRAVLLRSTRLVDGDSSCAVRPRVVDNLLRSVLAKNERLREHLDVVSRRSLRERILHYLRGEGERTGSMRFRIPLSRAELADFLHADRTAISRELSRMREDGLIDYRRSDFLLMPAV